MKNILMIACVGVMMIGLSSCSSIEQMMTRNHQETTKQNGVDSTSNILASRLFYGSDQMNHVAGGKLLFDYLLDEEIGQYMDWKDIVCMQNAVLQTPVHTNFTWTNSRRGVTYIVRPIEVTYNSVTHRYCRRYQLVVKTKTQIEKTFGHVCHESDGRWHIV